MSWCTLAGRLCCATPTCSAATRPEPRILSRAPSPARSRGAEACEDPEAYVRRAILTGYLDEQRRAGIFRRRQPVLATPTVHLDPSVEDRHDIEAALAVLSTQQRACITLRYLCDQPVDEIARLIGCSPGNVKRHLHDGLSRLRAALEPRQEHEHG